MVAIQRGLLEAQHIHRPYSFITTMLCLDGFGSHCWCCQKVLPEHNQPETEESGSSTLNNPQLVG